MDEQEEGVDCFFNDTATTEIYTLSLHDALPILNRFSQKRTVAPHRPILAAISGALRPSCTACRTICARDRKEHTSELQSRQYLVCRLLLEKTNHSITLIFFFFSFVLYPRPFVSW